MRSLSAILLWSAAVTLAGCNCKGTARPVPVEPTARASTDAGARDPLQPVSAFSGITDAQARSIALFVEAGRVITHPRCTNCHPPDDIPRQGMEQRMHLPKVSGGPSGHGTPGLPCTGCHRESNTPVVGGTVQSIPGNPKWALAPAEMAWVGRSLGEICEQLKDSKRNGGKSLEELHHHMAEDVLVGWGWNPGPGMQPVPGTQKAFGELIQAWIDSGAHCPKT
ncbi:Isoquinoline 1-oxidoreductase subunit [Archangium sp. Cb G35]|uniref:Isoquinoline 1-oxidoreductase subunit n=1 Tax=Archangium sp. Cb G35 TaxID=1920190 RepID=UPI0009375B7A|nr:Isoquinoline 1-oxidoreductase subunit [Archangium sp. Cb G35]OJT18793.1 Isoquinoline 1-oxidoreductase subunit [Archangium sp. Cb G35]